jgi:hypothetical protein
VLLPELLVLLPLELPELLVLLPELLVLLPLELLELLPLLEPLLEPELLLDVLEPPLDVLEPLLDVLEPELLELLPLLDPLLVLELPLELPELVLLPDPLELVPLPEPELPLELEFPASPDSSVVCDDEHPAPSAIPRPTVDRAKRMRRGAPWARLGRVRIESFADMRRPPMKGH